MNKGIAKEILISIIIIVALFITFWILGKYAPEEWKQALKNATGIGE